MKKFIACLAAVLVVDAINVGVPAGRTLSTQQDAQAQSAALHYKAAGNLFPVWSKYTVTRVSGGWQVNGGGTVAASSSGSTQNVSLFTLPANGFVHAARFKTETACTGLTTLTSTFGTSGSSTLFLSSGYDLMAAVSNTNISNAQLLKVGSDTAASIDVVAGLTGTGAGKTISDIAVGCSFTVSVLWSVLPS